MKKKILSVACLLALGFVAACGSEAKLREGWTNELVGQEKSNCVAGLPGQQRYCDCYVSRSSTSMTYNAFKNPANPTERAQLDQVDAACR